MEQNIQPVSLYKQAVKAKLQYVNVEISEHNWATISVLFYDEDGLAIAARQVHMTVEESNAWGGDDAYVLTLALQKLGIA